MSIQPYLTSDGKISSSMIQGGGVGANENIAQCLATGNDGAGLDMINVKNITSNYIDGYGPSLTIGSTTPRATITGIARTVITAPTIDIDSGDLKFQNDAIFAPTSGAIQSKYLIIKDNNDVQYKIKLFAMS